MLDVSNLYCPRPLFDGALWEKQATAEDRNACKARVGLFPPSPLQRKPVVVWNPTRTCNLNCCDCTTDSRAGKYPGELSLTEARNMIRDLGRSSHRRSRKC
jgi:uncharacterized radical SAM superfamily Fe-S cluster-containing enzyme